MIRRVVQVLLACVGVGWACSAGGCYQEISRTDKGLYVPGYGSGSSSRNLYRDDSKVVRPEKK